MFESFVYGLDVSHYVSIMKDFSETVLFVFLYYVDKKVPKCDDASSIFYALVSSARQWLQPTG